MKICFLSCEYGPAVAGGEGVVTQSLAEGFRDAGHEVRVAGLLERGSNLPEQEELNGIPVRRLRVLPVRGAGLLARYRLFRLVRSWAMAGEIDLVEAPLGRGLMARWGALPVPAIVRIHGTRAARRAAWQPPPSRWRTWFERGALQRADAICTVSQSIAGIADRHLMEVPKPYTVIPNPVRGFGPPDSWHPPAPPPNVVYAGGLIEHKGICELIRVWPRIHRHHPEAKLLIYGRDSSMHTGGTVSAWIHAFLRDPGKLGVRFLGHVARPQLAEAYRQATAVVLPSHYEAFGMAAAEAMWCGCPLVFTRHGSGPELVEDGVHGLLVDPCQPDSIADAILGLLDDPARAAALGQAAARRAQTLCDPQRVLALNLAFYEQCREQFPDRNVRQPPNS